MPDISFRALVLVVFSVTCCFLCHCGVRIPGDPGLEGDSISPVAERLLKTAIAANQGLESLKGIGRIELRLNSQPEIFTATWGGHRPDKLRIDVLAPTGQPIISFSCDGERIYFLSYSENKLHKRKKTGSGLKSIASIDISIESFLDIICGRIPTKENNGLRVEERKDLGPLLYVYDRSRNFIDTIYFDVDRTTVQEFERRHRNGKLVFHVLFEDRMNVDGYSIPESITIQNENDGKIHIDVRRAWVNPELKGEQFVLKES